MANILKMAIQQAICGLLGKGWSQRRVARELGVNRETVGRYARKQTSKDSDPARSPTASDLNPTARPAPLNSKPAKVTPGSGRSLCQPFHADILKKLELGLSGVRIWQDLKTDHDFKGSYLSIKRFLQKLQANTPLPFRRMETSPGEEAQVDFGSGYWICQNGKKRRTHVLRIKLSFSRKSYSEVVFRQTTDDFIRCLENAFRCFGGVPKTLVVDNLKAAVLKADWFDPNLNPKIEDFAKHYGFVILPTRPYTPRHKGKIESGIKYVKDNGLKGKVFSCLSEINQHLLDWETRVADTRIHGTTKKQVRVLFSEEKRFLGTLPSRAFPNYQEYRRKVHPDGHVEIARAYYSAPPEYVGHLVWVKRDARMVRIYNQGLEQIAIHALVRPGTFKTQPDHIAPEKISNVERGSEFLLSKAAQVGVSAGAWSREMLNARGIQGLRVLQGFLTLTKKYQPDVINQAAAYALKSESFRLKSIRSLCERAGQSDVHHFTQAHNLIRPLSEYQHLINFGAGEPCGTPSNEKQVVVS